MHIPKEFYFLCAIALIAGLLPLTAAAESPAQVGIPADLLRQIKADGQADFFVVMALQADLSAAYGMDWATRGEYVWNALNQVARATQVPVIDYATRHGLDWTSFLTGNSVYIHAGNLTAAQGLAALPGVAYLRLEGYAQVDPIITRAAAPDYTIDWGITDTNADDVWNTYGVQGAGIKVANIDTGVQYNHPALDQAYACQANPGSTACWYDPTGTYPSAPGDNNGHGTHTMGTMIGDNDATLTYWVGMAPDATWIACKGCSSSSCSDSHLNACADWILAPGGSAANRPNIVNNSWGGGGGDDWYLAKVQAWVAAGIFPAFSAGNSGSSCSTIGSPGDYQESFATAAHASGRTIASYSSRGPSDYGHDPYTKPNISAPGSAICSSVPTNGWDCTYNGTSMASPHTAGAVALLWSACPAYLGDVDATFQVLQDNADTPLAGNCGAPPDGEGNYTYGYGYLNALAAIETCVGGTGTLQGTVTDASTSLPISGATVIAAPAAKGSSIQATTDPTGFYSMILTPGTYNVTASADGYYSETATGVVVTENVTTTQDLALDPLPPPVYLLCDDMESGSGNWSHGAAQGTDDWALVTTSYNSATHAWYTANVSSVSDKRLWNTTPIAIPSGADSATLTFWHRYAFESGWDGSVIEISTDSGATWSDLGSYITQGGYNATIGTGYNNPLAGRSAWSGTAAWNEVAVNLTAFIGSSIQVRFRIGTDSSVAGTGWWIDDVCFSTQGGGCEPPTGAAFTWTPLSPYAGDLVTFNGSASGTVPISYTWDFGDGDTGSGASPAHTYTAAGDYIVTMTATNTCGSASVQHTVTVAGIPDVAVSPSSLAAEQCPDSQSTQTLQICNPGTAPLTWSLSETPAAMWLGETPASGTLQPAVCVDVIVTFDATGLAAGNYAIDLAVNSNDPDEPAVTLPVDLTVLQPADITGVTYTTTNLQVAFNAAAVGELPLAYAWDFGDGSTSGMEDPTHTYAAGGCYTVTLVVSNGCGQDTWTSTVCVCAPASGVGFAWSPASPNVGDPVAFDGSASGTAPFTYAWDFGDGGTANIEDPTHTYTAGGCYTVTLVVSNGCGQDTWTEQVCVCAPAGNPAFTWTPLSPYVGDLVTFNGSASGTAPIGYAWDFGDGGTGSGASPAHTYTAAGDYVVTMTATNVCGSASVQHTVMVSGIPDIEVTAPPLGATLCPDATDVTTMTICNTGTGPLVWSLSELPVIGWLSEDPASGTLQPAACVNVSVTFDTAGLAAGSYTTDLVVNSNDPDEPAVTLPASLTVLQPADITGVTYAADNLQVAFDAAVVGELPLVYTWDFGDGGAANVEDPTHTYAVGGCYTVTLVVSNGCGQDTWTEQVCVCDSVVGVDFAFSPQDPQVGETVSFSATVTAGTPPLTFAWDWGDGATGAGQSAVHAYAAAGSHDVTLTVSNACGESIAMHTVTIHPAAQRYFVYLPLAFKSVSKGQELYRPN